MKRTIERYLTHRLAGMVATGQINKHDFIVIDYDPESNQPIFGKDRSCYSYAGEKIPADSRAGLKIARQKRKR